MGLNRLQILETFILHAVCNPKHEKCSQMDLKTILYKRLYTAEYPSLLLEKENWLHSMTLFYNLL